MPALQEGEQHQCVRSRPSAVLPARQADPRALRADFDDSFKRSSAAYTLDDADEQRWATLAVLECRGCEIIEFDPQGTWACKGAESNTPFDEVELSKDEADWNDYDEKVRSLSLLPSCCSQGLELRPFYARRQEKVCRSWTSRRGSSARRPGIEVLVRSLSLYLSARAACRA